MPDVEPVTPYNKYKKSGKDIAIMIYRINNLTEDSMNPITKCKYDSSWIILMLTDSTDYQQMCGRDNGCAYTIKVSRKKYK